MMDRSAVPGWDLVSISAHRSTSQFLTHTIYSGIHAGGVSIYMYWAFSDSGANNNNERGVCVYGQGRYIESACRSFIFSYGFIYF